MMSQNGLARGVRPVPQLRARAKKTRVSPVPAGQTSSSAKRGGFALRRVQGVTMMFFPGGPGAGAGRHFRVVPQIASVRRPLTNTSFGAAAACSSSGERRSQPKMGWAGPADPST